MNTEGAVESVFNGAPIVVSAPAFQSSDHMFESGWPHTDSQTGTGQLGLLDGAMFNVATSFGANLPVEARAR
jgi:hypothetical protein